MRNNRLLITYETSSGQAPMFSMPQGFKESLRTKTLDGAKRIIEKKNSYYISSAVFTDGAGKETTLIKKTIIREAPKEDEGGGFKDVTNEKK